jgi:hypothetical protein
MAAWGNNYGGHEIHGWRPTGEFTSQQRCKDAGDILTRSDLGANNYLCLPK